MFLHPRNDGLAVGAGNASESLPHGYGHRPGDSPGQRHEVRNLTARPYGYHRPANTPRRRAAPQCWSLLKQRDARRTATRPSSGIGAQQRGRTLIGHPAGAAASRDGRHPPQLQMAAECPAGLRRQRASTAAGLIVRLPSPHRQRPNRRRWRRAWGSSRRGRVRRRRGRCRARGRRSPGRTSRTAS